jgi:ribosomal protein S27E
VKKYTYSYVKEFVEREGYELLSQDYINSRTKLKFKCPEGHIYDAIFGSFSVGKRCPICRYNRVSEKLKYSYDYIKSQIENEGHKLLSKDYKNVMTKIEVQCPEGHIYEVKYNNFKSGYRCPYCAGNVKLTYKRVKSEIEKEGYSLLSDNYTNANSKIKVRCPEGHTYEVTYASFYMGRRCPVCSSHKTSSKGEIEILKVVKELLPQETICHNDRTQIRNPITGNMLELDIWIPSLRKAIEFNGKYWHSFDHTIKKDLIKRDICKEKQINLFIIDENEWNKNQEECVQKVRNFIQDN